MKKIYASFVFLLFTFSLLADPNIYTPELIAPNNGATEQAPDVLLDWEAVTGTVGLYYEVQISTDNGFSNPFVYQTDLTSKNAEYLDFGTEYFWRVKAIDNSGSSDWSEVRSFAVSETIELDEPDDGDDDQEPNVPLEWKSMSGISTIHIELDTTENFNSSLLETFVIEYDEEINFVDTEELYFNQMYYWRAKAVHPNDESTWSEVWHFITLPNISLKKPNNHSDERMPDVELKWEEVEGVIGYYYQLAEDENFTEPITYFEETDRTPADSLKFGVTYYWRALAFHAKDSTAWSEPRDFTVIGSVYLDTPDDGETGVVPNPLFSWESISGIHGYDLQLSESEDFANPISRAIDYEEGSYVEYQWNAPLLDSAKMYYWRVRAYHTNDTSSWGDPWTFQVAAIGIESLDLDGDIVQVYPNPTVDILNVKMDNIKRADYTIQILDQKGQIVYSEAVKFDNGVNLKQINVSNFAGGVYFLNIEKSNNKLIKKFVIQ